MLHNLTDLISNPSTISYVDASTPESIEVASTLEHEHHPLLVSHVLNITCLVVQLVMPRNAEQLADKWRNLFGAMTQLVYESLGITLSSGTTGQADDSPAVQLTRAVRHSSHLQELNTFASLAKCCLDHIRWMSDLQRYVLHPALNLSLIIFHQLSANCQ